MASNGSTNGHTFSSSASASSSLHTVPLFINNQDHTTDKTFDVDGPATEEVVWRCCSASAADADAAVAAAQKAFPAWSKSDPALRRDIFLRAADLFAQRRAELEDLMRTETAAPDAFVEFNVNTTIDFLRDIAGRIANAVQGAVPWCADPNMSAMVIKEPYGVVLGIAPWNAPYILGMRSIAYPIAAGNTTILKGSELSPRIFYTIGRIFADAGLPPGVLNVLYHAPSSAAEITTALIAHKAVRKINFTGSTGVGAIIAQTAGKYIKPVLLELGGKASAIVCADADLKKAALQCAIGAFLNAGQICMSTERVLVHESVKEEFEKVFAETVEREFSSKGDAPVLITAVGAAKTKKLVDDALAAGATSLSPHPPTSYPTATRMSPIILTNLPASTPLYQTESFGPQVTIHTFTSEADAIAMANDTEYGLTAAVFTEDLARGLRIAKQIESGAVHVNHMTVHDEPRLPHGGVKMSGFGRFGGDWGVEEFLRTKTITFGL